MNQELKEMSRVLDRNSTTAESAVYDRYASAAQQREEALCCPVTYAGDYLAAIPDEIIERDYGCGDPSPYVRQGETVLDLGSGAGKLCYILSQAVGPGGKVIGVDCNQEMLDLARRHRRTVADRIGYANVEFLYGMIQDLGLDLDVLCKNSSSTRSAIRPTGWRCGRLKIVCVKNLRSSPATPSTAWFRTVS